MNTVAATPMSDAIYTFGPGLSFKQATAMRQALLQAFGQGIRRFDLSRVESFDSAGAQLLVALVKTAEAAGQAVEWEQLSSEVSSVLNELGLPALTRLRSPLTSLAP